MLLEPQEYLVSKTRVVKDFINKEIGVDYEVTADDISKESGSVLVFELEEAEHQMIRQFITDEKIWLF